MAKTVREVIAALERAGFAAAITAVTELGRHLVRREQPMPAAGHAVCAAPSC